MSQRSALPPGVLLLLGLAVVFNYIDRGNLATAAPLIQDELALSNSQIGLLLSAFFWAYAPSQLLAGWLVHRYDIRLVLGAGVALWALATALTGLAGGFASVLLLRLMLGVGESVTFPAWMLILTRHTAETERGRANGLVSCGQGIGPMLGTLFGGLAMAYCGWRVTFAVLGACTLLWLWPWFATTRRLAFHGAEDHAQPQISYRRILRRREFWGAATGQFLVNYAFYFVLSWLPSFLVKAGGYSVAQMAGIGATIYAVYALSTALSGGISDGWIRRGASTTRVRKTFLLVAGAGAGSAILASAFIAPHDTVWLLGVSAVFFGLSTPMIFAVGATLAGPRAAGRWAGAQNLAGQLAGILSPALTGVIIDATGSYSWAFIACAAATFLSMLAWGVVIRRVETVRWSDEDERLAGAPA